MRKILSIALILAFVTAGQAQQVPLGPRFVLPYQTVIDPTGVPIPGGQLFFYRSGTNTKLNTYADPLFATPNSNPVQANSAGMFPNIFLNGNYKVVLTDSLGNQVWTADPVYGFGSGFPFSGAPGQFYAGFPGASDSNDCLSQTVTNAHGPCATLTHTLLTAFTYSAGSAAIQINLAAGTYQGTPISGTIFGNAALGISGQYVIINGVGATTILTDTGGNAFVMDISSGAGVLFQNLEFNIPNNEVGIFGENGSVTEFGSGLTFNGNGSGSVPWHGEATATLESKATNTITFKGTLNDIAAMGQGGYLELDPGGTGILLCSSCTIASGPIFLLQNGATVYIGSGWSFSGFGTPSVAALEVASNSTLQNNTGSAIPGQLGIETSGGRLVPSATPTVVSSSNLGSGSATVLSTGSGTRDGNIILTVGTGPSTIGAVTLQFGSGCTLQDAGTAAPYAPSLEPGSTNWPAGSTVQQTDPGLPLGQIQITWNSNSGPLTPSANYQIGYQCHG